MYFWIASAFAAELLPPLPPVDAAPVARATTLTGIAIGAAGFGGALVSIAADSEPPLWASIGALTLGSAISAAPYLGRRPLVALPTALSVTAVGIGVWGLSKTDPGLDRFLKSFLVGGILAAVVPTCVAVQLIVSSSSLGAFRGHLPPRPAVPIGLAVSL